MAKVKDSIFKDDNKGQDTFAEMLKVLAGQDPAKIADAKKKVDGGKK